MQEVNHLSRKEMIPGTTAGRGEKHQNFAGRRLHFSTFYPMQRSNVCGATQGVISTALIRIQTLYLGQFIKSPLLSSILKSHSSSKTITTIQSLMTVCLNLFQSLSNIIMLAMTIPAYSILSSFEFSVSIRHHHISFTNKT